MAGFAGDGKFVGRSFDLATPLLHAILLVHVILCGAKRSRRIIELRPGCKRCHLGFGPS